ncbi:MAG: DNA/RNA helicase domain-containing protein [bacterium]
MQRAQYSDAIEDFTDRDDDAILGALARESAFSIEHAQNSAWREQIAIMKTALQAYRGRGKVYFEYDIPRLGRRIDVVAVIDQVVFVIEFKVGAGKYEAHAIDQVCDYALDLKNFHETSHAPMLAPVLVATAAERESRPLAWSPGDDNLLAPLRANADNLGEEIARVLEFAEGATIAPDEWERGRYQPTPTIIEAAVALYGGHAVEEISRNDAGAVNLRDTSDTVAEIIRSAKEHSRKAICFVTGVPGAGKTLVGLNIATLHNDNDNDLYSVFLSGNAPLVMVLREALARDKIRRQAEQGDRLTKKKARSAVQTFIQNVHHFRDECLRNTHPPHEHVALFDESQRAWNHRQTASFMRRRRGIDNFKMSEPEFLISCMDRHQDWAVIVCLVGGGQEIHTGEGGIGEWIDALIEKFPHWRAYVSPHLNDREYAAGHALSNLRGHERTAFKEELHLSTSLRSFRAERVSMLVKQVLDLEPDGARRTLRDMRKYPIVLTRSLQTAKTWLRDNARGSERYGMMVSSQAERLRPHAIDVRPSINPVHWFLHEKEDVRSSYYLEDVATEFDIQGLEVDWACVTWDADFRFSTQGWEHWSFKGSRWNHIRKEERQDYQKNAYRVLLTRARQGMVIVVPEGDRNDPTRDRAYYDPTFDYLQQIGFAVLD